MSYQKNTRLLVFKDDINEEIIAFFKDLYHDVKIIKQDHHIILFFVDKYFDNIKELIDTLIVDFTVVINYHEGIMLNSQTEDRFIEQYLKLIIKYDLLKESYTNIFSLIYFLSNKDVKDFFGQYVKNILNPIINKNNNRIILNKFFDNNLNVLKTSKDLFINRNSLTLRLETISKQVGYNIQDFKVASMILLLLNMKI